MEKEVFEFCGWHFEPLRDITDKEGEKMCKALDLTRDREINLTTYAKTYTHEGFYKASTKEVDLFRCIENGKIYVPCNHELFWCAALTDHKKNEEEQERIKRASELTAINELIFLQTNELRKMCEQVVSREAKNVLKAGIMSMRELMERVNNLQE